MEFSGTFELEDATVETVWLALSDPAMVQHALPGCELLVRVDEADPDFDELRERHAGDPPELTADPDVIEGRAFEEGTTYAALVETSVGSVSPSFETVVTIDERAEPYMAASGEGTAGNSSFEMESWMELSATDGGVAVEWSAEADVFGRLAQMGQRMINPVANRMTKRFFGNLQDQLADLEAEADADDEGSESEHPEPGVDDESAASNGGVGLFARLKRLIGIG